MKHVSRTDHVWLLRGLTGSESGVLKFNRGRLSFTTDEDHQIFNADLCELKNVKYPLLSAGTCVNFTIGGEKYRISFIQPGNTAMGADASISEARALGKAWKPILEMAMGVRE
jgi:hypothetical protein